eukprot:jgi/Psemu1/35460/gm1.35460_g
MLRMFRFDLAAATATFVYSYLTTALFFFFAYFDHGNRPFKQPWFELFHLKRTRLFQLLLGLSVMLQLNIFATSTDATTAKTTQRQSVAARKKSTLSNNPYKKKVPPPPSGSPTTTAGKRNKKRARQTLPLSAPVAASIMAPVAPSIMDPVVAPMIPDTVVFYGTTVFLAPSL